MTYKIRKMGPQDKTVLKKIIQRTEMFTRDEIDVAVELMDIFIKDKNQKDYKIYVAEDEKKIAAGYVCYGPAPAASGTFDLYWIAVDPLYQNQGLGKKLLFFTENKIERRKGRIIIIETSSQEKYKPTREFYTKNGYQIEARIKDFYRQGDDRLIFVKRFSDVS